MGTCTALFNVDCHFVGGREGFCFTPRPSPTYQRPVARVHLLSHIRLPLHRLHQNDNQPAALPPEAHTFVGTPRAPMVTAWYCRARRGKRYRLGSYPDALGDIIQLQSCECLITDACAKCRCRGLIRAGSSAFCARQRQLDQPSTQSSRPRSSRRPVIQQRRKWKEVPACTVPVERRGRHTGGQAPAHTADEYRERAR